MTSVTFDPAVGGDGSTVSDDDSPSTGLADGGHRTRFVPALFNIVSIAQFVLQKALDVAVLAASALGGTGSIATSSSTITIGTGTFAFDVGTGKSFAAGQKVGAARTSDPANSSMYGTIQSYSGSTLTIEVPSGSTTGTGTFSDWTIGPSLYGPPNSRQITGSGLVTGGGNFSADRVLNVAIAAVAEIWAAASNTVAITPLRLGAAAAIGVLTYGSTVNWNTSTEGYQVYLTLAGNPIIAAPTGMKDGWTYLLMLDQGGAGNRTISSWDTIFEMGSLGIPTLSTAATKVDIAIFLYSSITGKLHLMGFRKAS